MTRRLDSRIEEWVGSLPFCGWFDSRNSGDPAGYFHKILWVAVCGTAAHFAGFPAWYGGVAYLAVYVPFLKIPGVIGAWREWRRGESKLGPLHDEREHKSGIYFGFLVDAALDVKVAVLATIALRAL